MSYVSLNADEPVTANMKDPLGAAALIASIQTAGSDYLSRWFGYPERLYHYTAAEVPSLVAGTAELWGSHYADLNDSREVRHLEDLTMQAFRDEIKSCGPVVDGRIKSENVDDAFRIALKHAFEERNQDLTGLDAYVISLSALDDDTQQWRSYAQDGRGACIHFRTERLLQSVLRRRGYFGSMVQLAPVLYSAEVAEGLGRLAVERCKTSFYDAYSALGTPTDAEVTGLVSHCSAIISAVLSYYGPLCKHRAFRSEAEWRIIVLGPHSPTGQAHAPGEPHFFTSSSPDPSKVRRRARLGISRDAIAAYEAGPCGDEDRLRASIEGALGPTEVPIFRSKAPYRQT